MSTYVSAIHLNNWRGLGKVTLDGLSKVTFLTGLNGAGKTSILNAIQQVLIGECHDQEGKTIKLRDLVGRNGSRATAQIDLTVADKTVTWDMKITTTSTDLRILYNGEVWMQGGADDVRQSFWKEVKLPKAQAAVAIDPRACLLSESLGKRLAELGGEVSQDRLATWCGTHFEWLKDFLKTHNLPLKEFTHMVKIGKTAESERRAANAELKRLTQQLEAMAAFEPPRGKDGNIIQPDRKGAVLRKIDELRDQRDAVQRQIGAASTMRSEAAIKKDLAAARKAVADAKAKAPTNETVEERRKELRDAESKHSGLSHTMSTLDGEIKASNRLLSALTGPDGNACPTCKRPYTPEQAAEIIEPIRSQIAELEGKLQSVKAEADTVLKSLEPKRQKLRVEEEKYAEAITKIRDLEMRVVDFETEEPAPDIPALEAQVEELDGRIEDGRQVLDAIEKCIERNVLAEDRQRAYLHVEHLDWAVDAFRDGSAQNDLCTKGRSVFVARTNERLEPHGYKLDVVSEGSSFGVLLGHHSRGVLVPAKFASDGELLIAQMAVAEGFARGHGLGIIDGLDGLDGNQKALFFDSLEASPTGWVVAGAWGLGADPDEKALAKLLAPASVVWVDGDSTRVLR